MAEHGETSCGRVYADRSRRSKLWSRGTNEHKEPLEYHDWIIERRPGHSSTGTPTGTSYAATTANDASWRQQGRDASHQQTGFENAARQYEQAAHDRIAVAEAFSQPPADMPHELLGLECPRPQFRISIQPDDSVAEHAIDGQRHMWMSEALTENQSRDDVNRRHAEPLNAILSQGQAAMARLRPQLTQEDNSPE